MLQELADTGKKFSGITMDNIKWLFQKTQLKEELLIHLKDKRWNRKAKAIQQLSSLQQKDQLPNIFRLSNHNNDLVRMEAQTATVKLTGFTGLRFLNVIGYPVSEWQQLRLIQELSMHSIERFDDVDHWLKSKNASVIEFALRLVEIYQRYEFYDSVVQCLSHSSVSICNQAVITLGKISNEKTAGLLIDIYPGSDLSLQFHILKILQNIGAENEIPFLLSQLNHANDSFKCEAAKAIKEINVSGIERVEKSVDNTAKPWNIILQQLKMEGVL
ncbi:MAG TPA: HEAT repeat domain-containing protein [Chitinophagaceae bacterium]|nr:HEAT repeat domain-containing protein [Chitinophagaceae bacterium]